MSILRVSIERIQEIESSYILTENNIISAAISNRTIDEIKRIIKICQDNNVMITGSVFKQSANEIERIVRVCQNNNIEVKSFVTQIGEEKSDNFSQEEIHDILLKIKPKGC